MSHALIDPTKKTRIALPTPPPTKKKQEKKDRKQMLEFWHKATDIIDRIKAAPVDTPFYVDVSLNEAMDLLTINIATNRTLDESIIKQYAEQMAAGQWPLTSQSTIGYTEEGKIIDVQHRLWAIVDSGATIRFCVMKGIKKEAVAYYDIGKNRTGTDITTINGYGHHSTALANAIKNIILFNKSSHIRGSVSIRQVANFEIQKFEANKVVMDRMVKDLDYIRDVWMHRAKGFFKDHQWLTIYYILYTLPNKDPQKAKKFLDSFASGANMAENNPIMVIRQYFINDFGHLTKGKDKKVISRNLLTYKIKHVFKAWEMHCKGERSYTVEVDKSLIIPKPYFGA